jgi:membrane-bound lytic murein transglycosylase D
MSAANSNPDSDQSSQHRQRPRERFSLFLLILALILAGCSGQGVKPDQTADRRQTAPIQDVAEQAPEPAGASASDAADAGEDAIWARLRRGFQLDHISHPRVEHEIRRLQKSPTAFHALMARSEPFIYYILGEIEAAGMPSELALLPAVESGFQPHVYSPDGAAGLWQFMPATGRMLGLEQDWWYDERRSVQAATVAATRYLEQLHKRFSGDWLHALAAYNAGARTVNRAIRRATRRSEETVFWSLDLPGETDRYVPRLLAMAAVVADPEAYGLELPKIGNQPYFAATGTGGQIDLNIAARLAGLPVEDLLALNAGHKRWASRPGGPYELLLPIEHVEKFESRLTTLPVDQRVRWQRYRIKPGDNLNRIARQHGVTAEAIRRSNGLQDSRIRAGKDLLIPLSDSVIPTRTGSNQQARQRLRYRVRKGDSLYTIARRFQVSVPDLKRWNQVGRYIRPGERLTVFIDPDA